MAWTAPMTAVSGHFFSADEYNTHVRDNFRMLAPNLAQEPGSLFVTLHEGRIRERRARSHYVGATGHITRRQVKYAHLSSYGPHVTVDTGGTALVFINAEMMSTTDDAQVSASFRVTGETEIDVSDRWRITHDGATGGRFTRSGTCHKVELNPGSNTFTMMYRSGGIGPGTIRRREIVVIPI